MTLALLLSVKSDEGRSTIEVDLPVFPFVSGDLKLSSIVLAFIGVIVYLLEMNHQVFMSSNYSIGYSRTFVKG